MLLAVSDNDPPSPSARAPVFSVFKLTFLAMAAISCSSLARAAPMFSTSPKLQTFDFLPSFPSLDPTAPSACYCGSCGCCQGCSFSASNNSCRSCGAGTLASDCKNRSVCEPCPRGFFCPSSQMTAPLQCAEGTFSAASATECTSCNGGTSDDEISQCPKVTAYLLFLEYPLYSYSAVTIVGLLHFTNAFSVWKYVGVRKRRQDTTKHAKRNVLYWVILAILFGPLVWLVWSFYTRVVLKKHPKKNQKNDTKNDMTQRLLTPKDASINDSVSETTGSVTLACTSSRSLDYPLLRRCDIEFITGTEEIFGGMGTVRQAMHLGVKVAVKVPKMHATLNARDKDQFMKEINMNIRARHNACVAMRGVVIDNKGVMLVTEWMEGGSLYDALGDIGVQPLPSHVRVRIARIIADGLQYLHSIKIIHRDIKSPNILLTLDKNAKLCDFGLAKLQTLTDTRSKSVTSETLQWTAPEVSEGEKHSEASDVYSFGIVMWELMTCGVPFDGCDYKQIKGKLAKNERPELPCDLPEGFSHEYVALMQDCWHQDPVQRPAAFQVLKGLMKIDVSTQPNCPIALYPEEYCLSASCTMVEILRQAIPQNTKISEIATAAEAHIRTPKVRRLVEEYHLSDLEAQSIFVYTASQDPFVCHETKKAPYLSYNEALRSGDMDRVKAWEAFSFLLDNALKRLPSAPVDTVYRGLNLSLSEKSPLYSQGKFVYERQPTSTTIDREETLKRFSAGKGGAGTLIEFRVKNAKDIVDFSSVPSEKEFLIPQNTLFRVVESLSYLGVKNLANFSSTQELPPDADMVVLEEVSKDNAVYKTGLSDSINLSSSPA